MPITKRGFPAGWLIIVLLGMALAVETAWILAQRARMHALVILGTDAGGIRVSRADGANLPSPLLESGFVKETFRYGSPFGGGKTWRDDLNQHIRVKTEDLFASPRGDDKLRRTHEGVDLFVPKGTPVYPLGLVGIVTAVVDSDSNAVSTTGSNASGEAVAAEVDYGRTLRIRYPEGFESVYAHLDTVSVKPGQVVKRGEAVGTVGTSGNAIRSGKPPHLHMELRDSSGLPFDPSERLLYHRADPAFFLNLLSVSN